MTADPARLAAALSRAARFGPYFEAGVGMSAMPMDLEAALAAVGRRLGTREMRVAASSLQYEFAERLWSVSLGAWAFSRAVPDLSELRYRTTTDGRFVFGFTELRGWDCVGQPPEAVATILFRDVVDAHLTDFHRRLRATVKVADGLLWGNAATGLVLTARSAGRARSCTAVAEALLAQPPLAGRVTAVTPATMRRRSCCLFYRTAAGRMCGDCPLPAIPA